uniref:Uncharacterized protein n=1 Tax=Cyprinus carpio TaxID=7962 RepID=A0A8C1XNM4_CYPCA
MISLWNGSLQEKISKLHDDTWNIEIDETTEEHRPARDWHQYISAQWEDPNFPVENTDVLIERLARNIRMKFNGPHESAHCEDCHKGVGSQAN